MAVDPTDIVAIARQYRAEMLRRDAQRAKALARAWVDVTGALEAHMEALAARIAAGGAVITPSLVLQHERYAALVAQARDVLARFSALAGDMIGADVQAALALADDVVRETVEVAGAFTVLPARGVRAFSDWTADATRPLVRLIADSWPEAVDAMTRELLVAVGAGRGPAELARRMMQAFDVALDRALCIARTEVLRAYRRGQLDGYRESGVVLGYKRLASHDDRVCLGCLFAEGMVFDQLHDFDAHPNCRCTMVPLVIGVEAPTWAAGPEWFLAQSPERQREILGETRYKLWRDGVVTNLRDFATHTEDPEWGGAFVPTPLRNLRAA